jgi:hypothetical protein
MKVKIKQVPMTKKQGPNFNEMAYQYTSSKPLAFKDNANVINKDADLIGTSYPTEDKENANIEAEQGELILTKDFELYKINGKSHSKGGTPISANEGDFIFSKKLQEDGKSFNNIFGKFKEGQKYSYADVANKFLNLNKYKDLLNSKNPIDKKTAETMYETYKDKLGLLAFLQETSKGLPNGIPSISGPALEKMTEAPITEDASAGSTFMRNGGPILEKYGKAGEIDGGKKLTDRQWRKMYYEPAIKSIQKTNPNFKGFDDHLDYQEFVTSDPQYRAALLAKIKSNQQEITNEGRRMIADEIGEEAANKIKIYDQLPEQFKTDRFLIEQFVDNKKEYRGINIDEQGLLPQNSNLPVQSPNYKFNNPGGAEFNTKLNPYSGGTPQRGDYRDLGYNTNESAVLLNSLGAMANVPYFQPTRMQNYGLQNAQGVLSNVTPYNYQSLINQSTKAGYLGMQANNAISPNANIASSRNALIAGQLAEQNSKIKGEEYNQNANLYNNNQLQIADVVGKIGLDQEQQGELYNNKVTQGRENLWANKKMANKEFLMEFANANNNRRMRNTVDYLMASRDPNYRFANSDLSAGFSSLGNPFDLLSSNMNNNSNMQLSDQAIQAEYNRLKNMYGQDSAMIRMEMKRKFPGIYNTSKDNDLSN